MKAQFSEKRFTSVVWIAGTGRAVRFMRVGLDVVVYDPVPGRKDWLDRYLEKAMPALEQLGLSPNAGKERVRVTADLVDAVSAAQFVQESSSEVLSRKKYFFQKITDNAPVDAFIASSSAGFLAGDLRSMAKARERIIIGLEVQEKIGTNGQAPHLDLRTTGVVALRSALKGSVKAMAGAGRSAEIIKNTTKAAPRDHYSRLSTISNPWDRGFSCFGLLFVRSRSRHRPAARACPRSLIPARPGSYFGLHQCVPGSA
ncbi:hypothetical protein QO004_006184 [Rhizobium mesoamericanum]|nr:hypothetical protein [Rhizobium mesoamericanum]